MKLVQKQSGPWPFSSAWGLLVGLGWESHSPTWATLWSGHRRASDRIRRLCIDHGRTKNTLVFVPKTLPHYFSSPFSYVPHQDWSRARGEREQTKERRWWNGLRWKEGGATMNPSLLHAPSNGWMHHCQVASWRHPTVRAPMRWLAVATTVRGWARIDGGSASTHVAA
jgi:hypothetical protein